MYSKIFNQHASILKSLAHPKRLEIIHLLREQSLSVSDIQQMLGIPQANLSQHLQVLRDQKIVSCNKKGKQIFYQVAHKNYLVACDQIRQVLQQKYPLADLLPTAIDPVCGMRLTPSTAAFVLNHKNHNHYFCASGCLQKYKKINNIYKKHV